MQNEGHVRKSTSETANQRIDDETKQKLREFTEADRAAIDQRIEELDKEWDIERTLELNAATIALTGAVLGTFVNRKWLALPVVVTSFLIQHAIQGWCPPLPLFRYLGIRTRREIDREKFALKAMRGDFRRTVNSPNKAWQAVNQ